MNHVSLLGKTVYLCVCPSHGAMSACPTIAEANSIVAAHFQGYHNVLPDSEEGVSGGLAPVATMHIYTVNAVVATDLPPTKAEVPPPDIEVSSGAAPEVPTEEDKAPSGHEHPKSHRRGGR